MENKDLYMVVNSETEGEELFDFIIKEMSFKEVMELYQSLQSMVIGLYGTIGKD